jgi:hypothetical protein
MRLAVGFDYLPSPIVFMQQNFAKTINSAGINSRAIDIKHSHKPQFNSYFDNF